MKLDRNIDGNKGHGKYALIKLRGVPPNAGADRSEVERALHVLSRYDMLDWGDAKTESELFLIRLKDRYAAHALEAYANEAGRHDPEYADEIRVMADRAGEKSPFCKFPD